MVNTASARPNAPIRMRFIVGGVIILAAIVYLIVSSTRVNSQYFLTIQELDVKGKSIVGQDVRISGVVLGDTIQYDAQKPLLTFTVANVPGDNNVIEAQGGLAAVLHASALDPSLPRINVVYRGIKPDLLKNEAQAIMTGKLGDDGVFYASELLLKCPARYVNALPNQAEKK